MHQNRASPKKFASDFSPQTRVSQEIPQWESVLSTFIAEKIAPFASEFDRKEIAHLGAIMGKHERTPHSRVRQDYLSPNSGL